MITINYPDLLSCIIGGVCQSPSAPRPYAVWAGRSFRPRLLQIGVDGKNTDKNTDVN
jgi:hypothetical protein